MSGVLTYEQFEQQAQHFSKASSRTDQVWQWIPANPHDVRFSLGGGGYLVLKGVSKQKRQIAASAAESHRKDEDEIELIEQVEDPAALPVDPAGTQLHIYEYHVAYSLSYDVPVLYLRGFDQSGSLLPAEQIWADCCVTTNLAGNSEALPTPDEHPILAEPFFFVHPCKTKDFMKELLAMQNTNKIQGCSYLLPWLSVFGAAVGLRIPLELLNQ